MRMLSWIIVGVVALALLVGASVMVGGMLRGRVNPKSVAAAYQPERTYPTLDILTFGDGAVIPPDLAAQPITWRDATPTVNAWAVQLTVEGRQPWMASTQEPSWTPDAATWEAIKGATRERDGTLTVLGTRKDAPGVVLSVGKARFRTSADPVGAPILYREVILPFAEAVKDPSKIRWRMGTVAQAGQPPVVLENLPVCGNCHSFSADGKTLGMDVDYANDKGSYAIAPVAAETALARERLITWSDFKREDKELTFGLLSQVSPDGRHVVSTVKDRSIFMVQDDRAFSQLFFPIKGILAVYDREAKTFAALPGADDPRYVQSNPAWMPDGSAVLFARAEASDLKNLKHPESALVTKEEAAQFFATRPTFRYQLYRVPFNAGKGGAAEAIPGANDPATSSFFPKVSPDGQWLVFCRAKSFMLLQPDSALYIMPTAGGTPRRMTCNTSRMNSWHSWSPNGRWLVFASKANTDYTQLFLTHIDAQGQDSPPVLLASFTGPDRAANIPEFANMPPGALTAITERFLDDVSFLRSGTDLFNGGDLAKAEDAFRKAVALNPKNAAAHYCLGNCLAKRELFADAKTEFAAAIALEPGKDAYHLALGRALRQLNKPAAAVEALRQAVSANPTNAEAHGELGKALAELGNTEDALTELHAAVRLAPADAELRYALAAALFRAGKRDDAIREGNKAADMAAKAGRPDQAAEIRAAVEEFR